MPRSLLLRDRASLQHLFHGAHEALGVDEHRLVKLAALILVHFALLQRFQIETNGGDRSLELVSNGIDEAVVLLVAPDFAHQKDGIENESGDNGAKEDDAENDFDAFAPVEDDPAAAHGKGDRSQNHSEAEEERNRFAPAGNSHRKIVAGWQTGVRWLAEGRDEWAGHGPGTEPRLQSSASLASPGARRWLYSGQHPFDQ